MCALSLRKKKANKVKVKDLRLISLVTSLYNMVAKTLANGLRKALPSTISTSQGAFIVERQISNQLLNVNEAHED